MEFDEQGEPWPPPEALLAKVVNYIDPERNGQLVELQQPNGGYIVGLYLDNQQGLGYCFLPNELDPMTPAAQRYIDGLTIGDMTVFSDTTYDLRDRLESQGVHVTAASVATWTPEQVSRVAGWCSLLEAGKLAGPLALPKP